MTTPHTPHTSTRMPGYFIPHGAGPCFFMDWNPPHTWDSMAAFLKGVASTLPERPRAIIMVSAHWIEDDFRVTGHPQPGLIYDYYGFPAHTYQLSYPAPGEPDLAQRIAGLLNQNGLASSIDTERGFDHGMFIPLLLMFPAADIPVVQLSLRRGLDPQQHIDAGRALQALRDEGILVVGSGMSFHNMRAYGNPQYTPISAVFDQWLTNAVQSPADTRNALLQNWAEAPHALDCHPAGHEEHLIPLMVVVGAAGNSVGERVHSSTVMETTISAFRFN